MAEQKKPKKKITAKKRVAPAVATTEPADVIEEETGIDILLKEEQLLSLYSAISKQKGLDNQLILNSWKKYLENVDDMDKEIKKHQYLLTISQNRASLGYDAESIIKVMNREEKKIKDL